MGRKSDTYAEKRKTSMQKMQDKIRASHLLDRLIDYAHDRVEMSPSQANTALRLVGKVLPDLQSMTIDTNVTYNSLSIHELNGKLASLGYDPQSVWNQLNGSVPEPMKLTAIEHDAPCGQAMDIPVEKTDPKPG